MKLYSYYICLLLSLILLSSTVIASPDLVVQSVDAPSTASQGETISVTVTYKNQGTDLTQGSYVLCRMIVSPDTAINLADSYYQDAQISNSSLKSGWSVAKTYTYRLSNDLEGSYYIGAYVDASTYHTESNENNNANYDSTPLWIGELSPPELISPINNEEVTSLSLQWEQVDGDSGYKFRAPDTTNLIYCFN